MQHDRVTGLQAVEHLHVAIEVDGGVTVDNAAELIKAGARILVAGSAIFGKPDPALATRDLRKAAEAGL